jgi:hypothetical protein
MSWLYPRMVYCKHGVVCDLSVIKHMFLLMIFKINVLPSGSLLTLVQTLSISSDRT